MGATWEPHGSRMERKLFKKPKKKKVTEGRQD